MIDTQGLAFRFAGSHSTLRFDDVHVPAGGTLLLRGPSGSGKSTWLSLVAGLVVASEGRVSVAGTDLGVLSGAQRDHWRSAHVGVLPQRWGLSDSLSVFDNLALVYFAAGLGVDRRAIQHGLEAWRSADPPNSRAVKRSAWLWRGRSCAARPWCWPMNPPRVWTTRLVAGCCRSCANTHKRMAPHWSWPRTMRGRCRLGQMRRV